MVDLQLPLLNVAYDISTYQPVSYTHLDVYKRQYYNKAKKYGEAFINVSMNDSVKKNTLYGDYVYYNENNETGLATDSALLIDWSGKDTLWVHADTSVSYTHLDVYKRQHKIYSG